ncbi:MAG: FAD-dependent oxidoreductase [Ruminococcaceae bacterium]|nr:FAD-dependent oxidoreductase [Oscillospiraceae bacterium]MBR3597371.1 FAD-dependent oxidoreductase [Clostridia bacterium]
MKYDLIVAGGGLSGVAAAVSAAREGLKVLLTEKSGCLGGAISNCLIYPFMPYWTRTDKDNKNKQYLSQGIFKEMKIRHDKYVSDCKDHEFNSEYLKIVLDDMTTEAGVDVLFHGVVYDVKITDRQITSVDITAKSQHITAEADFFIDATGDGDLFYLAGCDFQLGRESDGFCQPMTTCFRMSGVDLDLFTEDRPRLQELYKEKQAKGEITNPRENILVFFGVGEDVLHFNTTRVIKLDPTNPFDVSRAEVIARRQIHELVSFLKENSKAFDESALISIAVNIGVRESRKLKGVHILTADELIDCTRFEDSVALGNYDIDIHNPTGTGTSHRYFGEGEYYTIPYRSLLPKEFDNLLVAGRCISATHEAQASVRILPICCCLGEAAGTAAALAHKTNKNAHTVDIKNLQKKLTENGAVL